MTETRRRIKAYQEALPALRERVAAVALLMVMSLTMMVSASFAWVTLSVAPEISGVSTSVAANGNLEIALVPTDGSKPADSDVGDSNLAILERNATWGNLINLSDPVYGLDNLTLRPAQLNSASLLTSPLYGAVYAQDGRIEKLNSNFAYTTWVLPTEEKPGYFEVSENSGVRAISSVKIEAVGAEQIYLNMVTAAQDKNLAAGSKYTGMGNNTTYMQSLATMMGLYMTARMNPDEASLNNPTCEIADVQNLAEMYSTFLEAFDAEADAMAALANLTLFLLHGEGNYEAYDADGIYATTEAQLKAKGIQISNLDQFIKDRNVIESDYAKLKAICEAGGDIVWQDSGLNAIVNNLVNVGACTIGSDNTPISSIGASNALSYLSGTQEARITNGILYRFEERCGSYIGVKGLGISATVKRMGITVPATVTANIQTSASREYNLFNNDLMYAQGQNTGDYKGGIAVAEDTYGLAIDLWVRTNASGSFLILEGNILTEKQTVRAMGEDANGNEVELYTISFTDGETGETTTSDVYQSEGVWYHAIGHTTLTEEEQELDLEPREKYVEIETVIGYEGENRIWEDSQFMSVNSTSQGSGSCYVYYADTPEDQAKSLRLLQAMQVAFIDEKGTLLGIAEMDTEHHYAESGRVTVPLVLKSDSLVYGQDSSGNSLYAIMPLEQNVATRITALVYLDGTKLTNEEVLAAADIQGKLNIQFGSSKTLVHAEDEKLYSAQRVVSAEVDQTKFNYDTASASNPMTTNVTIHVDGDEPSTVTAFFMRAINATQGSREETITFTKESGSTWKAAYTFEYPGQYVLRTVRLDGVDYDLTNTPTVTVEGFSIESLSCTQATNGVVEVLTAQSSSSVDVRLKFVTDDPSKMPSTVQGRFLRDDGTAANIEFVMDPTTQYWNGVATFHTSGEYNLQYLVLDGQYFELAEGMWQKANVYLGMQVAVYTTSPQNFKYVPSEMTENQKNLGMQVIIMDNTGAEMKNLVGAQLNYGMKGSATNKMNTDLTWNASKGYYEGELHTEKPGIYQFSNVVYGSNTITRASTSPVFTILSPEPPEYFDHLTEANQYKPNNDAVMNVRITNSSAATVEALIINQKDNSEHWVTGTIGGEFTSADGKSVNNWNFKIPTDANGYQDGNWKLTELKLWDVFGKDGTAYTEENPLSITLPANANNVTKVVSRINVSFAQGQSKNFGKDGDTVTGLFMQSYTISGLNVDISDFEGMPVSPSSVQLVFEYSGGSDTHGGYTSASLNNATAGATITVSLVADATGTHFVQTEDQAIVFAGSYTTKFSYTINGVTKTFTSGTDTFPPNAPVFSVWSKSPTVAITEVSPTGEIEAHTKANSNDDASVTVPGFTSTSATVYYKCDKTGGCSPKHKFTQPTVTIALDQIGYAARAELSFGADVHLYSEKAGTSKTPFTWTSNGTCVRYVGLYSSKGSNSNDERTTAGTITATALTLYDASGNSYTFTLATPITIYNPY